MKSKIRKSIITNLRIDYSIDDENDLVVLWGTIKFDDHGYRVGFKLFDGKDWVVNIAEIKLTQVLFYLED